MTPLWDQFLSPLRITRHPPLQAENSTHAKTRHELQPQASSIVSTFPAPLDRGGTKTALQYRFRPPCDGGVRPCEVSLSSSQTAAQRSELSRERCKPWRISMYNCVATCRSIRGAYPLKDCDCVDESQIFAVHGDGDWVHQKLPTAGEIGFSLNIFSNERRP
jgi:hypothetical protein